MNRKFKPFLLLLIILSICSPRMVGAQREYDTEIGLTVYAPCKIQVDFDYTRNVSVGDVYSLGPSLFEVTTSPIEFFFVTTDVDSYSFDLELSYEFHTIQTLRLRINSGSVPPSIIEMPVEASKLTMHFSVTVLREPEYPSTEEVTESVVQYLGGMYEQYQGENARMFRMIYDLQQYQNLALTAVSIGLLVVAGIVFMNIRRRAEGG